MTGSVALDVVIGLAFIYMLYSLLASIIQEIVANLLGLRARNLRHGISRMLQDEPKPKNGTEGEGDVKKKTVTIFHRAGSDSLQRLKRNFLKDKEGLLKEFYQQPVIKYLASGQYFSKPSYISESDFSKALLDILKEKGGGNLSNLERIQQTLLQENGFIDKETREFLQSLLDDAQNDLVRFKVNLEDWFNNTMERVTGWYKRTVQIILIIIGFVIAATFNVNSIAIAKLLSNDKEARENIVALASSYVEENKELIDAYRKNKMNKSKDLSAIDRINELDRPSQVQDTTASDNKAVAQKLEVQQDSIKSAFDAKLDSLLAIKGKLESDIEDVTKILGFRPIDSLPIQKDFERELADAEVVVVKQKLTSKQVLYDNRFVVAFPSAYLAENTGSYYEIIQEGCGDQSNDTLYYAEFKGLGYFFYSFWGYLITALAISLGAPFWFDVLNKIIRMRGSLQKTPKSASAQEATQKRGSVSINNRVG
ncbi:hypothetical protein [Flagellimonas sp.]|uniref:hypothetical protein n=1 Tax=Flagellimonas sp. TaxID=2058762 RepID=UPI003B5AEFF3